METALVILALQTLFGAIDNVLHHELTERLPARPSARRELALHSAREAIYGVLFLIFAWSEPSGLFAAAVLVLLAVEVVVTVADFIEEDRSRHLPPFERVLHTILAVLYGSFLAFAVPWLFAQAILPNNMAPASHGVLSWYFTIAAVGVFAFAVRNAFAVRSLARMAQRPRPIAAPPSGRSVLVTGATGFIGSLLVAKLVARGDRVFVLTRDARQARALFAESVLYVERLSQLPSETRVDAVVNLAGAPIIGLPWFAFRRREIWRSRIDLTQDLVRWMSSLDRKPRVLVSGSAIGIYGDAGDTLLSEDRAAGQGFGAELCAAWEASALAASEFGTRVACLRIGLVLDQSGGPLPLMALPVRFGAGAVLGSGRQWLSWITRSDLVRMFLWAIDDERWTGAINAVAPEPITHAGFQRELARVLHRPNLLRVPAWLLRTLLGEMSSIFLYSQRVDPSKVKSLGYSFDAHWAADALSLAFAPAEEGLQQPTLPEETAPQIAVLTGDHNDDHPLRRGSVAVRAQSTRGAGRKRAGL